MTQDDKGGGRGREWFKKDDVIYEQPLSPVSVSILIVRGILVKQIGSTLLKPHDMQNIKCSLHSKIGKH